MPLIVRAPMRISFGGGGTDLEAYYSQYGGFVVSATINKYFYTVLSAECQSSLQLISADYALFHRSPAIQSHKPEAEGKGQAGTTGRTSLLQVSKSRLTGGRAATSRGGEPMDDLIWSADPSLRSEEALALPRAMAHHFALPAGLKVFMASEVPPGTGLGSSSAVAVCLAAAFSTFRGERLSRRQLAELAAFIEIEKLGMPIGKQDQYASAFGGLNAITFATTGVTIEPLNLTPEVIARLEQRIMLFFTATSRNSSLILQEQRRSSARGRKPVIESLHAIKARAQQMRTALRAGDVDRLGELLDESWQHKKRLASKISNPFIDECYQMARKAGALGGKIAGAGGGGFLLLYCPPDRQPMVRSALETKGLRQMDFRFDFQGVQVLLNTLTLDRKAGNSPRCPPFKGTFFEPDPSDAPFLPGTGRVGT